MDVKRAAFIGLAIFVPPLIPAIVEFLRIPEFWKYMDTTHSVLEIWLTYRIALVLMLLLGVPLMIIGWRYHLVQWWFALIAGALAAPAFIYLMMLLFEEPLILISVQFPILGAAVGIASWTFLRKAVRPSS